MKIKVCQTWFYHFLYLNAITRFIRVIHNDGKKIRHLYPCWQHNEKFIDGFATRFGVDKLVYFKQIDDRELGIKREKRLKKYPRKWKRNLIEKNNPNWKGLYTEFAPTKSGHNKGGAFLIIIL